MTAHSVTDFVPLGVEVVSRGHTLRIAALTNDPTSRQPDVIWLHANGFNALTYRSTLATLPPNLKVVAIDQRGHGGTPQAVPAVGKRDALDMRDDLLALLDVLVTDGPIILAGHSLGGCVSLLAAPEAPDQVRGVALFDPVVLPRDFAEMAMHGDGSALSENAMAGKARTRRSTFASREEAFGSYRARAIFAAWPEQVLHDYVEAGFREAAGGGVELTCAPEWEAAIFAAHGHDIWGAMARIQVPVHIYRAEHRSTCAIAQASDFPRPPGQVKVETIAGTTHFLPIERPDVVCKGIVELEEATRA